MMRWSATSTAPTCRRRQLARSRVATASSMKYCSRVGRVADRRRSADVAGWATRSAIDTSLASRGPHPSSALHHFSTACSPKHTLAAEAGHYRSAMERTRLAAIPLFAELAEADLATIAAAAVEVEAAEG